MTDVTCAIIRNDDNEVLIVRRGEKTDHPFKWEFPGGKTADGETNEECIIREVSEELSMDIVICSQLEPVEHDYGHKHKDLYLLYVILLMNCHYVPNMLHINGYPLKI